MAFAGLDPAAMRDLASRADSIAHDVAQLTERAATVITQHQLDDFVGELGSWFGDVHNELSTLAILANTKATDMEFAAAGGYPGLTHAIVQEIPDAPLDTEERLKRLEELFKELNSELDYIRDNIHRADDDEMSALDLRRVRDKLKGLSDGERAWVLSQLTDEELLILYSNVRTDKGYWPWNWTDEERADLEELLECLPDDERVRFALAEAKAEAGDDLAIQGAMQNLYDSDEFQQLDHDQQIAILAQARNYPNSDSIHNLKRLAGKDWAVDSSLEDFQRSAKLVAYLSQYEDGDAVIQHYTLESFLAHDAPYALRWDHRPELDKGINGYAWDDTVWLNPRNLDGGNGSVEESVPDGIERDKTISVVINTVAHEVNHLKNPTVVSPTFSYFMDEYRAFYVGFQAEHGRPPTRREMVEIVDWMFNPKSGYKEIQLALYDTDEAERIAEFVSELLGEEVNPDEVREKLGDGANSDDLTAPQPDPGSGRPNNLDNS